MRTSAISRFDFTAEYWNYSYSETEVDSVGNPIRKYTKEKDIRAAIYPMEAGLLSIFSKEPLRRSAILRNVKDRSGRFLYLLDDGTPADMFIDVGEPIFNIFGIIEGYRYDLVNGAMNMIGD